MTCDLFFSDVFHTAVSLTTTKILAELQETVSLSVSHTRVFSWAALNTMFCTHYILQEAGMAELQHVNSSELKI